MLWLTGPAGAVTIAIMLAALAMLAAGVSPLAGFGALVGGALGGKTQIAETLVQTTALLFPALGIALAFRAGLFNIGAEGQLVAGALVAGAIGAHLHVATPLAVIVLLAAGLLGGGFWGAIAGWMRARFHANEVISTLMLNFVIAALANYLVSGPLRPSVAAGAETGVMAVREWWPLLVPQTRLSIAFPIALGVAALLWFALNRMVFGYEVRALGQAPEAARRSGVNVARMTLLAMTLSGAIAGAGGAAIVGGVLHRFNTELSPGYGYTAIAVALVGDLNPLWICVAAFGFGVLEAGGLAMQASAGVPKDAIRVIEGLIVLVLAARRYITTRVESGAA